MADYKLISQEYAHGAIKAAILINGGAAVALLSQAADLLAADFSAGVVGAMLLWSLGVFLGAFAWVCGFLSARYYDRCLDEAEDAYRFTSNRWMLTGVLCVGFSIVAFAGGAGVMAASFWPRSSTEHATLAPSGSDLVQHENQPRETVTTD